MLRTTKTEKPLVIFFDERELERNDVYFKYTMDLGKAALINCIIFFVAGGLCAGLTIYLQRFGWIKWLAIIPWLILAAVSIPDLFKFSFENNRKRFMEDICFAITGDTFWALFFIDEEVCPIPHFLRARAKEGDNTDRVQTLRANCENYVAETLRDAQKKKVILGTIDDKNFHYVFNRRASIIRLDEFTYEGEDNYSWFFTYADKDGLTRNITFIKGYPGLKEKLEEVGTVAKHNFPFPWLNRPMGEDDE